MGRGSGVDSQSTVETNNAQPQQHVDTDGEHRADVARNTSIAGLRREAGPAPAGKSAAQLHSESDGASFDSARTGLIYIAKKMQTLGPTFDKLSQSGNEGDAGASPAIDAIQSSYDSLIAALRTTVTLINVGDKDLKSQLAAEVIQVNRAFSVLFPSLQRAINFVHHSPEGRGHELKAEEVQSWVQSLSTAIGANDLPAGDQLPDGSLEDRAKAMVKSQIQASHAGLESVKAGNDADIQRVINPLIEISQQRQEKGSTPNAQERADLKKMQAEIGELLKESPKPEVADKLREALQLIGHVLSGK